MNTNDSGTGSLRQALADANDGDTISFDASVTGTITLTSGELLVNDSITISGPGANTLAVNGNHASRVFHIALGKTVTISGLTITNGSPGAAGFGGGIYNYYSMLTVSNSTISGNSSFDRGGGIYNDHSMLTVSNSTVSGNSSNANGGGIYNDYSTVTVSNSAVTGNSANHGSIGGGGGIYNSNSTLTVSNSTVSGNGSTLDGGGIYNVAEFGSATVTIASCTLSGNSASGTGGAIYNFALQAAITSLTINNSTLSGNAAGSNGGGIYTEVAANSGTATLDIGSTILKTGASGVNIYNAFGTTVTSHGYNLSSDNGGGYLTATGDQINTDPMLGPLQDNGGPTFTHALLTGSPAINAGDPTFTPPPNYDQRGPGYPRVVNGRIDIGAFEVQATAPVYAAQVQQPINADGTSVFNVRRGVVPVKFTLTLNGVSTCNLPSATIAVTRTAGGVIGPIDESSYTGPADTGSNFRIDSCQYVYNLSASALGAGTYRVDIIVNTQVVGSATFALR